MQTTFRASIDFRVKATVAICIFFAKSVSKDITCYPIFKIPNFGSWNSSAFQTSRVALNVTSFKCIYLNSKIMSLLRQNTLCNCKHFKNVHFITKSTERESCQIQKSTTCRRSSHSLIVRKCISL